MESKWRKGCIRVAGAFLMTVAPGMNMAVQRKLKPDAIDLGGYLYQAVGRTVEAFGTDRLTMAFMFCASMWLLNRYLFKKPARTGVGEYLLCGFFSLMMLCCASIRATETVQTLYANAFQLVKAALYLPGMFLIFLCGLRGLNEALQKDWRGAPKRLTALWGRRPFWFPFLALAIAWLPHVIIKYPGVLMMDCCVSMRAFLGMSLRESNHPPFTMLMYGLTASFGNLIGSRNIAYFLFTSLQTLGFLAVLSYSLWLMNRMRVPAWVRWLALLLYAVSPIYVGWSVVMVKDSPYFLLCLLTGVMLTEFAAQPLAFLKSRRRVLLMGAGLVLLCLMRYNGFVVAAACLTVMLMMLAFQKAGRRLVCRFAIYAVAVLLLPWGVNEALIEAMDIYRRPSEDWMSIINQQTARVTVLHGDELSQEEREILRKWIPYDNCAEIYDPVTADPIKWYGPCFGELDKFTPQEKVEYYRLWLRLFLRYPMDYLDATLNMNSVLFDLQSDAPMYISLTDHTLGEDVYHDSFNDMSFYESEPIRPLNSLQRALTEYYYRFGSLPLIGQFASMGFCMDAMLTLAYLSWVNRRRLTLLVMLPALLTGVMGLFCPVVYTRYLLPMIGMLPMWLAAYTGAGEPRGLERLTADGQSPLGGA